MKVLVLSSLAYSLVNFRGALLRQMVAQGHEVVACAPDEDDATIAELSGMQVRFRSIPMDRTGTRPVRDLGTLFALVRLLRTERPDVILAYTQKPIIYGGIAARLAGGSSRFFAMISGLGHVYSDDGSRRWGPRAFRSAFSFFYRIALARAEGILVFNADDAEELRRHGIVARGQTVVQVPGSGVDTRQFHQVPLPDGPPTFLLIARMMRSKGIGEFVQAAAVVRAHHPEARFQVLGPHEEGPGGFTASEMASWAETGVEYLGATRDVRPYLAAASALVLPTYYREGLPRTILEAMATGRTIITTDTPGCRETVVPGVNGWLVPPRDVPALAQAMMRLAGEPDRLRAMGVLSRRFAEQRFRVEKVNAQVLAALGLTEPPARPSQPQVHDEALVQRSLALVALVLVLPLLALVAVCVRLWLGSPVLFRQSRAGRAGQAFELVKFRSMSDRRDAQGRLLPDDMRLGGFGRWLRRTRIDELPELWNIARGDMGFVGPRPLMPETLQSMGDDARRRGWVRPGLTGWAQVNGNSLLSERDKLALDLWYIEHRSLGHDLAIVLRTIGTIVAGERIDRVNIGRAYAGLADRRR